MAIKITKNGTAGAQDRAPAAKTYQEGSSQGKASGRIKITKIERPQTAAKQKWTVGNIGQYGAGNIDLYDRPQYRNANGSISTVDSTSYNIDGQEVLLPTVWNRNGTPYHSSNDEEILQRYRDTGEYLGKFSTVEEANDYAEKLHLEQQERYPSSSLPAERGSKHKSGKEISQSIVRNEDAAKRIGATVRGTAQNLGANASGFLAALVAAAEEIDKEYRDAKEKAGVTTHADEMNPYPKTNEEITRGNHAGIDLLEGIADTQRAKAAENIRTAKEGLGTAGRVGIDAFQIGMNLAGIVGANAILPGLGTAALGVSSGGSMANDYRQAQGENYNPLAGAGLAIGGAASVGVGGAAAKGAIRYGGALLNKLGLGNSAIAQNVLGALSDIAFAGGMSATNEYAKAAAYGDSYEDVAISGEELAKDMLFQAAVGFFCRTLASSLGGKAEGATAQKAQREYFKDIDNLDDLTKAFKQYGRQYHPDRFATADAATQREMNDLFAKISAEYNAVKAELAVETAGRAAKAYSEQRTAKTPKAAQKAQATVKDEIAVMRSLVESGAIQAKEAVEAVQILDALAGEQTAGKPENPTADTAPERAAGTSESAPMPTSEEIGNQQTVQNSSPAQGADHSRQRVGGTVAPPGVSATQESKVSITPVGGKSKNDPLTLRKRVSLLQYANEGNAAEISERLNRGELAVDANGDLYRPKAEEHIDQRDSNTVGERRINAFQFDHPEVHSFYKEAAADLMEELNYAEKGGGIVKLKEHGAGDDQYIRMKRTASERIAKLLDDEDISYADIERSITAIINDKGQENFAAAKRVELMLDNMLSNGYRDIHSEYHEPNADYLEAKQAIPGASETAASREELPLWDIEEKNGGTTHGTEIKPAEPAEEGGADAVGAQSDLHGGDGGRRPYGDGAGGAAQLRQQPKSGSIERLHENVRRNRARTGGERSKENGALIQARQAAAALEPLVSSAEVGVSLGTDTKMLHILPRNAWDQELLDVEAAAKQAGISEVVMVTGLLQVNGGGSPVSITGVAERETNRIVMRVDSRKKTASELGLHEIAHFRSTRENVEAFAAAVQDSGDGWRDTLEEYRERYKGAANNYEGMTPEDADLYVWEEIMGDAYAGIDCFGQTASQYHTEAVRAIDGGSGAIPAQEAQRTSSAIQKETSAASDRKTGPPARFSYAGRNANGANLESLREAQEMQQAGADMESIRKATGWHEGMDGKWRWEIDDSKMEYHRAGDALFGRNHPEYAEQQRLEQKMLYGELTDTEQARLRALTETWGRERNRLSERVERGNARLEDVLDHEELFHAYPQLRHVRVAFDETPKGVLGSFSAEGNQITISEELRDAPQDVLIHEIQHAIQNAEGFAKGSNRQYWEEKLTNGDEIQSKGFQEAREKLIQFQLDEANEEVLALRDQLEKAGELDDGFREYDRIWEEAERRGLDKKINEYYDLRENYYDQLHKPQRSVPSELYYNTAGEIEARDAANRRPMSGETRKRIKPDYGNGDTVFANGGDSYSYVGKNADGIEVYETSEEVRNMPYKQRMDVFTDIMRNEYAGRTAKFTANGDVYYAKFDSKDISKNIYGDKRSSPRGWRAKINTGADGNIFELVENAAHKSSDADTGKLTSPHRGVTGWEYFVKTVQIDGRVYDLLANVRKKPDGEYVYSIQLNENKKTPASPVAVFAESNPASDVGEAGTGSIAEMGEGVKPLSLPTVEKKEPSPTAAGNNASSDIQESSSGRSISRSTEKSNREISGVQPLSLPTLEPTTKTRFSLDEPVEETETLVAMHNMTEEKLRRTLDIGAWPSPSIAVVKAREGHANYGEYSAVFPRGTIDPQADSKNKVYGGDAWTPTHDNAIVERGVNYEARRAFDDRIKDLSSQFAGGVFQGSGTLGKIGLENDTRWEPEEIADKLANHPEVQAAFLQSEGKSLEPVYRDKQFDRFFSNATIRRYLDTVGEQEAARLAVKLMTGERLTAEEMKPAEQAIRDVYAEEHANFLNRRPESKEKRIDYYMKNNVFPNRVEDFIRSTQEFYESGGSAGEIDKEATAAKMMEMIAPGGSWNDALRAVKDWVKPQLEGLLGERGIYNGKDAVTDRGRRSFAETHWDYTAENIVKAMNMAAAKGANVYGITPETLAATATQEYKTVDEMHADEARLRTVSEEEHAKALRDLGIYLDRVVNDLMLTTMHKYDNSFEEEQNLSGIIAEAAKGKKTAAAVKAAFRKEGYAISDGHAKSILALIDRAANIPTGYFEAKPQRVVGFDEALAVVAPDNAPADLLGEMRNAGMNVVEYKAGDEADRLAKVNSIEKARFSVDEDGGTVALEASTVDQYLKDYASKGSPRYAQAYIAYMTPRDFLDLTTSESGRSHIERTSKKLDPQELGDASRYQPIQLRIDHETGEVVGHEGRHRAYAMQQEGIESIPVLLFDSSNKYSKEEIGHLTLYGQDFGNTRSTAEVGVSDLLPLSYANRDQILERFTKADGGNAALRYSVDDEQDKWENTRLTPEQKEQLERARARARGDAPRMQDFDNVDDYFAAMRQRAEAERKKRMRNVPKEEFEGTEALQDLGIKIENSAGLYQNVEQMIENDKAAKKIQREIRRAEKRLSVTPKEKSYAAGIAAGIYDADDIPSRMNASKVMELADYYTAEQAMKSDTIPMQRQDISQNLRAQAAELFKDTGNDTFEKKYEKALFSPKGGLALYHRTPQRSMRAIFGWEQGQKINEAIFEPVYVNEQERKRFVNRMHDEVRRFEDKNGKQTALTEKERALTQLVIEGKAVAELVAASDMKEQLIHAAENLKAGGEMADVSQEFGLHDKEARDLARRYADWLQTQEDLTGTDVDQTKVEHAVEAYRTLYDKFYKAINHFLVAHGYEPIGFIKGYAPHFQPEAESGKLEKALKSIGVDLGAEAGSLPASIAGLTKAFKPNKRYNPFFQHRAGKSTEYDVEKGFEKYVDYLSDVLYHTDDIMRVRAAVKYFREEYGPDEISAEISRAESLRFAPKEAKESFLKSAGLLTNTSDLSYADLSAKMEEYVEGLFDSIKKTSKYSDLTVWLDDYANKLAGKQLFSDRDMEREVGRTSLNVGRKLNKMFARANVAGNLSSSLNQTAQLPMIAGEIGPKYVIKAVNDIIAGKTKGDFADQSDFLTEKNGIDYLTNDKGSKITSALFWPLERTDYLISSIAVRGKYRKELDAGRSPKEAMKAADRWARDIMGTRSKGAAPLTFQSKNLIAQMVNMFQVEALNSWEHVTQDLFGPGLKEAEAKLGKEEAAKRLAGIIVATLLGAFLLNRVAEEGYGGTPAQFDVIGLLVGFLASGNGLSTNEQIATWIDDAWENGTGERLFGTDANAGNDEFDAGAATEDTLYNVSNDIPYLRNAAGLLGLGDQTLPMPDIYGTVTGTAKAVKDNGPFSEEVMRQLMGLAGDTLPGGRQAEKTYQGIETLLKGGYYKGSGEDERLQYPVSDDFWNVVQATMFGRNALSETRDFYAAGGKGLSAAQTRLYKQLVDMGADSETVYDAILAWKKIDGNEALSKAERETARFELVQSLPLTSEERELLHNTLSGSDTKYSAADEAKAQGIPVGTYQKFQADAAALESDRDKDGNVIRNSKKEKVLKLIDSLPLNKAQKNWLYLNEGYAESKLDGTPWQ